MNVALCSVDVRRLHIMSRKDQSNIVIYISQLVCSVKCVGITSEMGVLALTELINTDLIGLDTPLFVGDENGRYIQKGFSLKRRMRLYWASFRWQRLLTY